MHEINLMSPPFASEEFIVIQPCFNTQKFYQGQAVEVAHHDGEVRNGVIGDCTKDYMSIMVIDKLGLPKQVEVELEDCLSGVWIIKLLK